jgi:aldehyde dehydrogenase (NAD+)
MTSLHPAHSQAPVPTVAFTKLLINGRWVESASGKTFPARNPATGEQIAQVAEAQSEDVDAAVVAARSAFEFGPWSRMSGADRGKLLYRLAELIENAGEELSRLEALDSGKPVSEVRRVDLPLAVACYRYFAGWADKITGKAIPVTGPYFCHTRHEPIGVIGQIIPWNFPLLMQSWKLAPALAASNTVVLKPAEQTPLTALRVGQLILDAGFPRGVVNILPGYGPTAGAAIAEHPDIDKIALTGSAVTGRAVLEAAAKSNLKRVTLELGGKSANIVFSDADLDQAIEGVHMGLFLNQGQCCCAGSRVFVDEKCFDEFVVRIVDRAKRRVIGDPLDPATEHGPLIDETQRQAVMGYIDAGVRENANLLCGGNRVGEVGNFVAPTVFAPVSDEMTIAREEIFGPVMSILKFRGLNEVIERANSLAYGLAAGVWTRDSAKAHQASSGLKAGTVWVNCYDVFDAAAPFGGFKQSGIGRELGEYGLEQYVEVKSVITKV